VKRRDLLALLAASAKAQQPPPTAAKPMAPMPLAAHPILRAMADELNRSRQLRLAAKDPLYFVEYALDDTISYSVLASLGGLITERSGRARIPRIGVRVGGPEFDNTNYVLSDYYPGSRFDPDQFPLDDNYDSLRRAFWLATDRAFKTAVEAIGRKRAALRSVTQAEKLPDFSAAPQLRTVVEHRAPRFDQTLWRNRTVALSAIYAETPEVIESSVECNLSHATSFYSNSEATVAVYPDPVAYIRTRATGQCADGMRVRDHDVVEALEPAQFPPELDLRRAVAQVAANVKALAAAPLGENYTGPVLFEGAAAAQLFAEFFSAALPAIRRPVGEPGRPVPVQPSPLEGKIGSRILPASFDIVDDPTQRDYRGKPLLGYYPVDIEGVAPTPVSLVEKGVLKALLTTRQPARDALTSTGRARLPGAFGGKTAAISNLFVKCSEPVPSKEMRARLTKLTTDRGKPYALAIKKMDFPSSASVAELRRLVSGPDRGTSMPLLAYRVYPDGREELVRGLRFRGFNLRSLREIAAASDEEFGFGFLGNAAPFSLMGAGGYGYLATVFAPSILLEDVELDLANEDQPRPPVAPPPPSTL